MGMYQFAAMMGFPNGLTFLDFGFILILGIEDLFFFFWSSRPMIAVYELVRLVWSDSAVQRRISRRPFFSPARMELAIRAHHVLISCALIHIPLAVTLYFVSKSLLTILY